MNLSDILLIILIINFLFTNKLPFLGYSNNKSKDNTNKSTDKKQNDKPVMHLQIYNDIKTKTQTNIIELINYLFIVAQKAGLIKETDNNSHNKANSIIFEINKESETNNNVYKALLQYLSKHNKSKFLKYQSNTYYVINDNVFSISDEIQCKILEYKFSLQSGEIEKYKFELFSTDESISVAYIKEFIDSITEEYEREKNYTLGRNQYYFNEIITQIPKTVDGGYRYEVAPKTLCFSMSKFSSNCSMKNIFGSHLHKLKERVEIFINNREWYEEKGIPYNLGIMLSGPPGTGKTSIIKAIAADSGRHIINVNLRDCTTKTQLYKLFYDEEIVVNKTGEQGKEERINVPLERRIYVIEDIDCMSDIVLDREILNFNPNNQLTDNLEIGNTPIETIVNDNKNVNDNEDIENIDIVNENIPLETIQEIKINNEPDFKDISGEEVEMLIQAAEKAKNRNTEAEIQARNRAEINKRIEEYLTDDLTSEINNNDEYSNEFVGILQIDNNTKEKYGGYGNNPHYGDDNADVNERILNIQAERDAIYEQCAKNVADGINPDDIPSLGEVDTLFERIVSEEEVKLKLEPIVVDKTYTADLENDLNKRKALNAMQDIEFSYIGIQNKIPSPNYIDELIKHCITPEIIMHPNENIYKDKKNNENNVDEGFKKFQYIMNRREQSELKKQDEHPEKLTLSDILNIFDGVLETPGRIIIATSNHPYVLDPALVRPGRIDIKVETGYCDADMVVNMFTHFYGENIRELLDDNIVYSIVEKQLTPAELKNILLTDRMNIHSAINSIINS
jgi:SpoVK/Ycf46/Vps4 family AAA+-type ATPase